MAARMMPKKEPTAWQKLTKEWNLPLIHELHCREPEEDIMSRLERIKGIAMATPVKPVGRQFIVVARRGDKIIFRRPPRPSDKPGRKKVNKTMEELTKMVKGLTYEQVAMLVGGRVVDVGEHLGRQELKGKKGILVDGQVLNKTQAIMKLMKGKRFVRQKSQLEKLLDVLEYVLTGKG